MSLTRSHKITILLSLGASIQLGLVGCTSPKVSEEAKTAAAAPIETAPGTTPSDDPNFQSERTAELLPVPVDIDTDLTKVITTDHPVLARTPAKKTELTPVANETDPSALADTGAAPPSLNERGTEPTPNQPSSHSNDGTISYVVKGDDTLMKISFEVFGNAFRWREILSANKEKIGDYNNVPRGTVLTIHLNNVVAVSKNGDPYLIVRRDTLAKISSKLYGTPKHWWDLWDNNRELIHNPNRIFAGFTLYYRLLNALKNTPLASTPETPAVKEPKVETAAAIPAVEPPTVTAEAPRSPAGDENSGAETAKE